MRRWSEAWVANTLPHATLTPAEREQLTEKLGRVFANTLLPEDAQKMARNLRRKTDQVNRVSGAITAKLQTAGIWAAWLELETGKPASWWTNHCQALIKKHSKRNPADKNHDLSDVVAWTEELARSVRRTAKPGYYDGNIRQAMVLGLVLATWALKVCRAKAWDPRRPMLDRQASTLARLAYLNALLMVGADEREDASLFPGQPWDDPFGATPIDGDFV